MIKRVFLKITILLIFTIGLVSISFSQDLLKGKDLSKINVDALSEAEITKLKTQLSNSGMSPDQAEQMAISKGLPLNEAIKLKQRLNNNTTISKSGIETNNTSRENANPKLIENLKENNSSSLINPLIFGSELYTNASLSFEPNLKLATPTNYILGPDDQIQVSVYGVQEYYGNLQISAEGSVTIPNVGEIKLSGLSIEAATQKLKFVMGNSVYSYLKTGGSKITVTLSKIKTISITIIGSNHPGNYKVSSFSSIFNALFIAGGPSQNGSFREIELLRNDKAIKIVDLYKFLVEGNQSDNLGLKDNDVIRVPVYKTRIEIQGQVKRPGIFEVLPTETFSNILKYASGFTDTAYRASIKVFRSGEKLREVKDLQISEYSNFIPKSGDVFVVSKILNKFQNRVTISGAVHRPDIFELSPNLRVADLIRKADGLKQDALIERGQIIRYQEDLTKSIISFNIKKALLSDTLNNVLLQREDEVIINSKQDLKDIYRVTVQGEIRHPGNYEFVNNLTLKDLIMQAGGFTDAAFKNIEVARLLKRDSVTINDNRTNILLTANIEGYSFGNIDSNLVLAPFDVITIRKIAGYQLPESVTVTGQVQYQGIYSIEKSNERISDILKRAGGITVNSYPEGAYLKRYKTAIEIETANENAKNFNKNVKDSTNENIKNELLRAYDKIPLDLVSIIKKPGDIEDIFVKNGDELVIPKFETQVKLSGEILSSTQIPFQSNLKFKDYISAAGGFTTNALKSKTYVVYANGKAASTRNFLFFKNYPSIQPGCELIVPRKREKKNNSLTEIVGLTTILASLTTTFVLLKQ